MNIAVVTGASSGLGREYIHEINRRETDIAEIWAVARRQDRLEEVKNESAIPVRILPYDLTDQESISLIENELKQANPRVRLLINAAGLGKIGDYTAVSRTDADRMIDLNCRAAIDMTYLCLPYMDRGSRILEICSTAGFQPFQHLSVYAASKAFLYRFSRALRIELLPRGIHVTAVCPYWIRDTEFIPVAKDTEGKGAAVRHFPLSSKARSVVSLSFFAAKLGLPVATPGIVCTVHRIAAKFIPSELMMGIWAILRRV